MYFFFFFKQKTAYEISDCLVGSEMCIRDRSYIQAATEPFPVRVNKDGLYDHILTDLKDAANLVPWRNEVSGIGDQLDERITKGTIKALRARIALARGGYSLGQNGTVS